MNRKKREEEQIENTEETKEVKYIGYTKEEIREMLKGYREVKKERIKDIPRYTRIRYYDDRFKSGGMFLGVDEKMLTLKNGKFIWKVRLENLRKIWVTAPEILKEKERQKEKEKEEIEKCKKLISMIKKGEVEIIRKKK